MGKMYVLPVRTFTLYLDDGQSQSHVEYGYSKRSERSSFKERRFSGL